MTQPYVFAGISGSMASTVTAQAVVEAMSKMSLLQLKMTAVIQSIGDYV